MAIQSIDTEGNLTWNCLHRTEEAEMPCGASNGAHISHEQIQWTGHPEAKPEHHLVSLPPCPDCGGQTFLKVHFTARELKAPNMWLEWNSDREAFLQNLKEAVAHPEKIASGVTEANLNALNQQIQQLEQVKANGGMHTPSHAVAQRHIELARQLVASGKTPATN